MAVRDDGERSINRDTAACPRCKRRWFLTMKAPSVVWCQTPGCGYVGAAK